MYHIKISLLIILSIYSIFSFSQQSDLGDKTADENKYVVDEKDLLKIKKAMNDIKPNIEMNKRAAELEKYTKSDEYIERQAVYEKSIASIMEIEIKEGESIAKLSKTDQLILFVSSSMPIDTLRRYAKQIDKVDGLMVLRGTIGDGTKIQPTLDFLSNVLKIDDDCEGIGCDVIGTFLTVDPRLFRLNNIKQVPALVFSEDLNLINYASGKESDNFFPSSADFVVYGDATLLGMVREIHRKTKNNKLKSYIKKLTRR